MIVYTNMKELSEYKIDGWEFEILNELKDCSNHRDENCLYHTRFLFEMDSVPLKEQCELVQTLKDNITRVVYSGSKSLHTIIEFDPKYEQFCKDHYKQIWRLINELHFGNKCDTQCVNPSRLTRTYGVVRASTGKEQRLLYNCPGNYYKDAEKLVSMVNSSEIANAIKKSLDAKQTAFTDNGGYNPNGKCLQYDDIQHYLNTPYPKLKGNGDSSISLFKALRCCIKYHDAQTMECVLNKARNEHWTEHDLNRMMDNIKNKYIN